MHPEYVSTMGSNGAKALSAVNRCERRCEGRVGLPLAEEPNCPAWDAGVM